MLFWFISRKLGKAEASKICKHFKALSSSLINKISFYLNMFIHIQSYSDVTHSVATLIALRINCVFKILTKLLRNSSLRH